MIKTRKAEEDEEDIREARIACEEAKRLGTISLEDFAAQLELRA